jgi:hypothetical protein
MAGKDPHIDILVTTRNRPELLKQTLGYIWERTTYPYCLHVIDDSSGVDVTGWLTQRFWEGSIHHLYLRGQRSGCAANQNLLAWASFSDPVILVDDDVLCPLVEPDWLGRLVAEMEPHRHPHLIMCALNHPGAKRQGTKQDQNVTICHHIGATFAAVRRDFLVRYPITHARGGGTRPMAERCDLAQAAGFQVGYLTHTYSSHIGHQSVLTGHRYEGEFIPPQDPETLIPPPQHQR